MKNVFLKRMAIVLIAAVTVSVSAVAQTASEDDFGKGTMVFSLGLGLGSTMYGAGYGMKIPPVSASLEFCILDNLFKNSGKGAIGIAPTVGYASYGWGSWGFSDIMVGAKGNFHYQFIPKLDTYAGVHVGYGIVKWDAGDYLTGTAGSGLYYAFLVGGRYYFANNLAGWAELGYGVSVLNIGIAVKF